MEDKVEKLLNEIANQIVSADHSNDLLYEAITGGERYEIENRLVELEHNLEDIERTRKKLEKVLDEN